MWKPQRRRERKDSAEKISESLISVPDGKTYLKSLNAIRSLESQASLIDQQAHPKPPLPK